ncbi:DctP family TRAP transporter solute-binding subunit [Gemmobacter serpentinus]|uniref:DctP family TRAP transporter solute-binding subunit n=1 Tax=Gemmobacter serpentinus TaxID=2652247 RepID=UPI00124C3875|nr:DctP family TRAP transporter solute-binding subunit [Gemmobacter serpentinus]
MPDAPATIRKTITRRRLGLVAGSAALGLAAPLPLRAAPVTIKFSHVVAPDTPKGKAAQKFADLAAAYTEGAAVVEVYPNSQLYKDKDEMEALQLGAVQMLAPSLAKFSLLGLPQFELFDLPFLIDGHAALRRLTDGPIGRDLLGQLATRDITGLAYWDNGFKLFSANRPLVTPADFKGLILRIQASRTLEAQMTALGALPQVMAFSEVFQALQAGLVDGTENPPSNMFTQNMHQVQSHAVLTDHGYLGYALIVHRGFWDRLDRRMRDQLEQAVAEATLHGNSIARDENAQALIAMQAAGTTQFHQMTPSERAAFVSVLHPVHAAMADRIGPDLLRQCYAVLGL